MKKKKHMIIFTNKLFLFLLFFYRFTREGMYVADNFTISPILQPQVKTF